MCGSLFLVLLPLLLREMAKEEYGESSVRAIEPTVSMEAFMQMMSNMSQCPGRWMDVFLRANPPRFPGTTNSQEANNWLRKIQKTFAAMECPEERKVSLVELLLENDSESWWETHKRISLGNKASNEIPWKEFVTAFEEWYCPVSATVSLINMAYRFTQNNLPVYDFEAQFASLLCHVPEIANTEEKQISLFKEGLDLSIKVMLTGHTTYRGIVGAAKAVEHELQLQENKNKRKALCIEDRKDKSCFFCHQPGHRAFERPNVHKNSQR